MAGAPGFQVVAQVAEVLETVQDRAAPGVADSENWPQRCEGRSLGVGHVRDGAMSGKGPGLAARRDVFHPGAAWVRCRTGPAPLGWSRPVDLPEQVLTRPRARLPALTSAPKANPCEMPPPARMPPRRKVVEHRAVTVHPEVWCTGGQAARSGLLAMIVTFRGVYATAFESCLYPVG